MNVINKNTHALLQASKKTGLAVNIEKIKYMFASRDTQCRNIKYFKTGKVKRLGTNLTNQNYIHDESKCRLNSWTVCVLFCPGSSVFQFCIQKYKH
jgi:hypothetical protein